jgi:hypothetical protein
MLASRMLANLAQTVVKANKHAAPTTNAIPINSRRSSGVVRSAIDC